MVFQGILPIGTVIMLKGGNHRLMVTGYAQKLQNDDALYDYVSCLWPEGYSGPDKSYVFNGDAVEMIYFIGYQTDGQQVFASEIDEAMKKYRSEH